MIMLIILMTFLYKNCWAYLIAKACNIQTSGPSWIYKRLWKKLGPQKPRCSGRACPVIPFVPSAWCIQDLSLFSILRFWRLCLDLLLPFSSHLYQCLFGWVVSAIEIWSEGAWFKFQNQWRKSQITLKHIHRHYFNI